MFARGCFWDPKVGVDVLVRLSELSGQSYVSVGLVRRVLSYLFSGLVLLAGQAAFAVSSHASPEVDQALFERGKELYEAQCTVCHEADGKGAPPAFPALSSNERLEDLDLIVSNVHRGRGGMPAFPHLGAQQLAALATFIRSAWDNDFGGVSVDSVERALEAAAVDLDDAVRHSVWDGMYTPEQAKRGMDSYANHCAECHGADARGGLHAPRLTGLSFFRSWDGHTVQSLFEFTRASMPPGRGGSLTDQAYVDVIAYILERNDFPAGTERLTPDRDLLQRIFIEREAQ